MKQKSGPDKAPAEQVLKDIRRQTHASVVPPARNRERKCLTGNGSS